MLLVFFTFQTNPFCQKIALTSFLTSNKAYAIKFLCNLFEYCSKPHHYIFFSSVAETLNWEYVIQKAQKSIDIFADQKDYTSYSFKKRAITLARMA